MAENLDNLLSVDHLFDIPVHGPKRLLLTDKMNRTLSSDVFHHKEHHDHHNYYENRQRTARIDHSAEHEYMMVTIEENTWGTLCESI